MSPVRGRHWGLLTRTRVLCQTKNACSLANSWVTDAVVLPSILDSFWQELKDFLVVGRNDFSCERSDKRLADQYLWLKFGYGIHCHTRMQSAPGQESRCLYNLPLLIDCKHKLRGYQISEMMDQRCGWEMKVYQSLHWYGQSRSDFNGVSMKNVVIL